MARFHWLLAFVPFALLAAFAAWWLQMPDRSIAGALPAANLPTEAQRRELQAQSDAACSCARRLGNDPWNRECWAEFERSLARYEYSETASMCGVESVSLVCFGPSDWGPDGDCIFRERSYRACSAEEARIREAQARSSDENGCG